MVPRLPYAIVTIEVRGLAGLGDIGLHQIYDRKITRLDRDGRSEAPGSAFDVTTVTAHVPGTDAAWAVGSHENSDAMAVGRGIIECNPG